MNLRLSQHLLPPLLLCASLAGAAEPSADATSGAGCESLLTVVRRSLEEEISAACPAPAPAP
ncbi:hypothetical protein, partial [Cupriavidus basilensis]|uniref:hypothetical protein n=1 Tax=Cupriavidus basilensis TaxID=68895 RepID=UPI001ED981A8